MRSYLLFGRRIDSAITLPELPDAPATGEPPDLRIELGPVPRLAGHATLFGPVVQIGGDGQVRLDIPAVAAFRIDGGHLVTIEPAMATDAPDIRVFLFGTVLAVLCFRWGLLPLHAGAVESDGRALLVTGESGAGKSTLTAALAERGHRLVADDLCALDFSQVGAPAILPAFPRLKLWADSAASLGIATRGLERSRLQLHKFHIPVAADRFRADRLPPKAVFLLRHADLPSQIGIERKRGHDALRYRGIVHRAALGAELGYGAAIFKGLAALLQAAPLFVVARGDKLGGLADLADRVLEAAG